MVRSKLAAAILSASLALPGIASALGVGDYTSKSFLNQPLDLEIPLIQTKDLTTEEIVASLASQEDFDRAGVERDFSLQDIHFDIERAADGSMRIHATTSRPVTEPFLNFLVEVQWPQGRMLREYTILLDPPVFKNGDAPTATAEPVTQPEAAPESAAAPAPAAPVASATVSELPPLDVDESGLPPPPTGGVAGTEASPAATPAPAAEPAPSRSQPAAQPGEYKVQANDTMWEIASQNRGAGSVQQTMIAIQRANPDAFIKGNVNLVKKGAVLRIPGEAEVQQISTSEARAEFASQTKAWRELLDQRAAAAPVDQAPLEAAKPVAKAAPAAKGTGKGEVTLVAPTAAGKGGKAASGKEAEALQNQLAIAEEGLDKAARENKELSSRLSDLDQQIKSSDKLLAMKSDQIASLQKELDRLRKEKGLAEKAAAEKPAAETATPAAAEQPAEPVAAQPKAAPEKPKAQPVEEPVAVEEPVPAESSSMLKPVLGGLVLLGAAGAGFWFWRRRQQSAGAGSDNEVAESHDEQVAEDLAQLQDLNAGAGDEHAAGVPDSDGSDPVGEADMYVAYGRFQQAADILYAALQREPERDDIRLKLAEVYAEMGDTDAAREQASALSDSNNADIRRQAEAVLKRTGGGGGGKAAAEPEEALPSLDDLALEFTGGKAEPAADTLSFDLDEPAPSAKTAKVSAVAPAPAVEETLDFSLDDVDLGETPEPAAPAPSASTTEVRPKANFGELSLEDTGLEDFNFEEAKPAAAAPAAPEFSLDEDLTLEEAPAMAEELTMDEPALEEPDFAATTGAQAKLTDQMVQRAAAPAAELDLESELADLQTDLKDEGVAATGNAGDDFDFLADSDENATKLDLAKAYIDMGDADGARDILNEVVAEGNATQKAEAQKLLSQVG